MSLRTRLVLAFFTLSVVPLAAVTIYSYTTNAEALRVAAEREADLLAGELGMRMQSVTAQLSERVEHLMDIAELQTAADAASQSAVSSSQSNAAPAGASVVSAKALMDRRLRENRRIGVGRPALQCRLDSRERKRQT